MIYVKICGMALQFVIVNPNGDVQSCCFTNSENQVIGNLFENTLEEVWNGEKNFHILDSLAKGDYSVCDSTWCPYLINGKPKGNLPLWEIDEIPKFPLGVSLSYDLTCNYNCTSCRDVHKNDVETQKKHDMLADMMDEYLPHMKTIFANGWGEVFVSSRILKQLASWKPLSPKEEISVMITSNGSLFNERNWKKIENLGQYNLRVQISVMSFDDHLHRTLSGTNVPISVIEDNLRFVKKLRDEGIVNKFVISSVVQDRNFRTMPDFVRHCLEEFDPDEIQLQPIIFVNKDNFASWLTDVRNKAHPYHEEYVEVMSDPIFKNPKVVDYGAWKEIDLGEFPAFSHVKKTKQYRAWESQIFREIFTELRNIFD